MIPTLTFDAEIDDDLRHRVADALSVLDVADLDGPVDVAVLTGGAMNQNFVLRAAGGSFVLRLAGGHVDRFGLDRALGLEIHRAWQDAGVAPRLYGSTLPSGDCVSEFLDARTLDVAALHESGVAAACARVVSVAHHVPVSHAEWSIFDDIRRYVALAREEKLSLPADFSRLIAAVDSVERAISLRSIPLVTAHNDLQIQNYLLAADGAWLIDMEYAGVGNPYLDLGMLVGYGGLSTAQRDEVLSAYFGRVRDVDHHRLELMYFVAALREAVWSVCAQPTLDESTGWSYSDWAHTFFGKARAVLGAQDFLERVERSGSAVGDDRAFESAAAIAAEATPYFRSRRGARSSAVEPE